MRVTPSRAIDYSRSNARHASPSSTPLDPDWLYQRRHVRYVSEAIRRHAIGLVVDVGCGGRRFERYVPVDARYTGIDTPAVESSRPDLFALAHRLPLASASVDTVLCTEVLEHLADPAAALAEIARVLRPGGHAIVTAPQTWFLHEEPFDFYRFTRFGLEYLCKAAGLRVVERKSYGGFWAMAGVFTIVHLGSYLQWGAEWLRPPRATPAGRTPWWRNALAPLRLPMAAFNVAIGALDDIPHPGIFALGHLVVTERIADPVGATGSGVLRAR